MKLESWLWSVRIGPPLAGMDVEYVEGNLLDADSLARAAQGVDKLYHLAALFRRLDQRPGPALQN